jgi:hypothetical protein
MKKLLLLILLFAAYYSEAQTTLTVNNSTGCSVTFYPIASHTTSCDLAFTADPLIIPAGHSGVYTFSSFSWHGGTISPGDEYSDVVVKGDVVGITLAEVGTPCSGQPASTVYAAPCSGAATNINYATDEAGNVTVNIW